MKFDLVSDFHYEQHAWLPTIRPEWNDGDPKYYDWPLFKRSDVLVMPGDTANSVAGAVKVYQEAARYYDHIIFTDGNHEHYFDKEFDSKVSFDEELLLEFAQSDPDQYTYLDSRRGIRVGTTLFIGACGWYDFQMAFGYHPKEQQRLWKRQSADSMFIRFGRDHRTDENNRPERLAERQAERLAAQVEKAQEDPKTEEIVVVTHTAPHPRCLITDRTHPWYPLNGAYGNTDMQKVWNRDKAKKIRAWCVGHTHILNDFIEHDIRFISNPRGYAGEIPIGRPFSGPVQVDTEEELIVSAFGPVESS